MPTFTNDTSTKSQIGFSTCRLKPRRKSLWKISDDARRAGNAAKHRLHRQHHDSVAQHDAALHAVEDGHTFDRSMAQRGAADVQMLRGDRERVGGARKRVVAAIAAG